MEENELGLKIKKLRKEKGLTQAYLAERMHTTVQTISKYEHGTVSNLPINRLKELAEILGADPAELMGFAPADKRTQLTSLVSKMTEEQAEALLLIAQSIVKPQG